MHPELYVPAAKTIAAARTAAAALAAAGLAPQAAALTAATRDFAAEAIPSRLRRVKEEAWEAGQAAEEAVVTCWRDSAQAALARAAADATRAAVNQADADLA